MDEEWLTYKKEEVESLFAIGKDGANWADFKAPVYVGYWDVEDYILWQTQKKPSLWKRFWVFVFFGIKWKKS